MNKNNVLIIMMAFSSIMSCSKKDASTDSEQNPTEEAIVKKVLIIGIDGCRPDALTKANTPNLDALMANGTYSLDARNSGITSSGPGWSAMLTGVWEDKHKVVDNSFTGNNFNKYPHFFKRIKEAYPSGRTVSVSQWHPINEHIAEGNVDIMRNTQDTSTDVKNKAIAEVGIDDLSALFVHFDDVDHAGHSSGFSTNNPAYLNAIETVDSALGEIVSALKKRDNYIDEEWAIIVSTDHGGFGTSHGGNSEEERTIFMIVSGDGIPNKKIAKTTTEITLPPVDNCLASTTELHFDLDTSVEISNNSGYNFGENQDFSIECRVRTKLPNDVSIVAKKNWESGLLPGYVFSFKPSTKNFKVNVGDGSYRVDVEAGIITDNEWHTLSATFNRDGNLSVYIDGVLKNSASMSVIGNIDNSLPFTIGADGNNAFRYSGYLAEVRVFNTLLSGVDIENWKCKVLDVTHSKMENLVGYWKLTEGMGEIIEDSSSFGAEGVLAGGAWEDATVDKINVVSNYENTPRSVDVVKTALNHLCIPIQPDWNIKGKSWLSTDCSN